MKKIDNDAAKLAALPLDELEALAAPMMNALRMKREIHSKEESRRRRQEYDRLRREKTIAVTIRMDDAESAAAIRNLVKQLRTLAKLNGRTVAAVVAAAVKRLPVGRRKSMGNPKNSKTKITTAKKVLSATTVEKVAVVNTGKTNSLKADIEVGGHRHSVPAIPTDDKPSTESA